MARIVVTNNVSLDGVMQSPMGEDEDMRGGFTRGGWAPPYGDEVMAGVMAEGIATVGALLLGRRTYEHFYAYWPHQPDNPFTDVLTKTQKYVVSRMLTEPLPWENSTLLRDEAAVAQLRASYEGTLVVLGSGELVRSLLRRHLVDELLLSIYPLLLGSGTRLFAETGEPEELELVECTPTTTGVLLARYLRKD